MSRRVAARNAATGRIGKVASQNSAPVKVGQKRLRADINLESETARDALNEWSYAAHKRALRTLDFKKVRETTYHVSPDVRDRVRTILEQQIRHEKVDVQLEVVDRITNQVLQAVNGDRVAFFEADILRLYDELEYVKTLFRTSTEPSRKIIARLSRQKEELLTQLNKIKSSSREPISEEWIETRNIMLGLFRALYANETPEQIEHRLDQYVRQTIHLDLIRRSTIETIDEIRKFMPQSELLSKCGGIVDWQEQIRLEQGDIMTSIAWLLDPAAVESRQDITKVRGLSVVRKLFDQNLGEMSDSNWLHKQDPVVEGAARNIVRKGIENPNESDMALARLIADLSARVNASRTAAGQFVLEGGSGPSNVGPGPSTSTVGIVPGTSAVGPGPGTSNVGPGPGVSTFEIVPGTSTAGIVAPGTSTAEIVAPGTSNAGIGLPNAENIPPNGAAAGINDAEMKEPEEEEDTSEMETETITDKLAQKIDESNMKLD
jgi:hypothetical protein